MTSHIWRSLSLRAKGLVVALIPLGALLLSSLLFYLAELEGQNAQHWVTHTLEVRSKIQQAHAYLEESETYLRGYFLTGDSKLLGRSIATQRQLEQATTELGVLVQDNADQTTRVQKIAEMVQRKRTQSKQAVLRHAAPVRGAAVVKTIQQSRITIEALRQELRVMRQAEEQLTVERHARLERARTSIGWILMTGILVGVAGGLGASFVFTRGIDFRLQQLNGSAHVLAQGQPLPVGSWQGQDAIESLGRELEQTGLLILERQNKLHEANDYLNYLIGAMPGVLVRLDKNFKALYVSPNAPRIFGYSLEEIFADSNFYSRTLHPQDRDRVMQDLTRAIMNKATLVETQRRVLHKSGEYRWMHSYVRPEYDENNNVVGLLSYSVDVTELIQTQEALASSEALFRNSFDFAPIGITLMSLQHQWLRTNRAMCDILGYNEEEFLQMTLADITHPDDQETGQSRLQELLASEIPYYQVERRYLHRDGHIVWVQVNVSLVRDSQGQPLYFIGQVQDISQRKIIEEELARTRDAALELAHAKANFMANMSHEIRTPLNGIIGMVGLLCATELSTKQRDFLTTLQDSADALLVIINDILDFSKIEAGKMEMEKADFDLNTTVESCLGLLASKSHARSIELGSLIYREVPLQLRGDAGRLRQVLLNLLDNAIKFTPQKGETMLRITRESDEESHVVLRFAITDSGIGIDEEIQKRLFQPFAQADGSTTRRYGGTGLGLAICKQLVELMGGQIGVNSQVGKGSTFWFTARFEKQSAPLAPAAEPKADLSGRRILIVDSHATHRRLLQQQVTSWDFRCDTVATGADAIEIMYRELHEGEPYHAVVINRQLEDMDALLLAQTIRAQALLAATRLVMMVLPDDDAATFYASGVDNILVKPIRQSQLFNCLTEVTERGDEEDDTVAPVPARTDGNSLHILVAEDNAINQKVVVNQLSNLGHTSMVVSTGRQAIEEWRRRPYALILMDCHMPEMDGYTAAREIRRLEVTDQHIPIIALTANALKGDRDRCIAAGMDDYISKPVRPSDLEEVLHRWGRDDSARRRDNPALLNSEEDSSPVVQVERLEQLQSELSPQLFQELLRMFLTDAPRLLRDLTQVWDAENAYEIGEIAHNLKSICATLGADRLAMICGDIQEYAEDNALDLISPLMSELEEEFEPVEKILSLYLIVPAYGAG